MRPTYCQAAPANYKKCYVVGGTGYGDLYAGKRQTETVS